MSDLSKRIKHVLRLYGFFPHRWRRPGKNPYVRECIKCGRIEHLYGDALGPDVWEEVYPIAHSPEKCSS